jgi:Na+/H+-dicarboxylate symporter
MKKIGLTGWIMVAMAAGVLIGLIVHYQASKEYMERFSSYVSVITEIFLRLIRMIIAPLVFSNLVVGIASLGDVRTVGRIGGKTMVWFIGASLLSLVLGLIIMNLTGLGQHFHLPLPDANARMGMEQTSLTFKNFIAQVFPRSVIEAMANNEILQIVVFAVFFGLATAAIGEKGKILIRGLDAVSRATLKVTEYVMKIAPLAAFAAIASIIALKGPELLKAYFWFILTFYAAIIGLWLILMGIGSLFIGRRVIQLMSQIKDMVLLAFSTASSESAFPKLIVELEKFGCPNKIVSFELPLGYSFNLDGSMLYMTFASLFIAQVYGISLSLGQQISMLLVLMFMSKGLAGVPRAALVVISGTLALFNIPLQGVLLLLGIDQLLDMARSATNVVGNSIATAVVSKMENVLAETVA